jgi:hypothetical protein
MARLALLGRVMPTISPLLILGGCTRKANAIILLGRGDGGLKYRSYSVFNASVVCLVLVP